MVIDALSEELFRKPYDRNGEIASRGKVNERLVRRLLRAPFFRQPPPRTAGREQFGREFTRYFIRYFTSTSFPPRKKEDALATATAFTAASIADSIQRFVVSGNLKPETRDWQLVVSGGGVRNQSLMRMLAERTRLTIRAADEFGLPSEAKEAVAFAVLAYQTWQRQPGNIPAATGATRPAILGKISYP
jgi:anhydro-N-acetylmuramic acid kinase